MSKYCSVSCCRTKSKQGIALHRFPRDPQRLLRWTEFVRRSARGNDWTPSTRSLLCSLHFAPGCYVHNPTCLDQYGSQALRILERGAFPTISASACSTTAESEATSPKQRRLEASTDMSADYAPAHSEISGDVEDGTGYEVPTTSGSTSSDPDVSLGATCTPVHVASGSRNVDAQTRSTVNVGVKATQTTLKLHTRSIRVQATCTTREVACG